MYIYTVVVSAPQVEETERPAPVSSAAFTPIRFRTADEFRTRPAWRDMLDHREHKLLRIIGDYSFGKAEELACGLKECRTKHQNGYVVQTADGLETHIGRDCGKKYFNVNWGEVQSAFNQATEERDIREWLESMLRERDSMLARANALYAVLANRTDEVRDVLARLSKEPPVLDALQRVTRAGGAIQIEREIDQDMAEARGLRPDQRKYLETVGRIFGLEVLQTGYRRGNLKGDDLLGKLRAQVMATLPYLSAGSLKALNARQRKERVKEIEAVKAVISEAEKHVEASRRFLTPANLREIAKLPIHKPNERAKRILHHFASLVG